MYGLATTLSLITSRSRRQRERPRSLRTSWLHSGTKDGRQYVGDVGLVEAGDVRWHNITKTKTKRKLEPFLGGLVLFCIHPSCASYLHDSSHGQPQQRDPAHPRHDERHIICSAESLLNPSRRSRAWWQQCQAHPHPASTSRTPSSIRPACIQVSLPSTLHTSFFPHT